MTRMQDRELRQVDKRDTSMRICPHDGVAYKRGLLVRYVVVAQSAVLVSLILQFDEKSHAGSMNSSNICVPM